MRIALAVLAAGGLALTLPFWNALLRGPGDVVEAVRNARSARVSATTVEITPHYEMREIFVDDGTGTVRAMLRLPRADRPCAALIIVGGLKTGRDAVHLVDADLECAVAAIDYAGKLPRKAGLRAAAQIPRVQRDMVRTSVALRDLAAYLERDPAVDAERVFFVGASLGVPFAAAAAAAAPPSGLVFLHGFADHTAIAEHRLSSSVRFAWTRRVLAAVIGRFTAGFDVRVTLPHVNGVPILVVEASDDEMVPPQCRAALWNATSAPRERATVPGGHLAGASRADVLSAAIVETRRWLARRGVPELAL